MSQTFGQETPPQTSQTDTGMPVPNPGEYGAGSPAGAENALSLEPQEWMRKVDENADVWAAQARESIRENPLGTVAGALVAGLLLARLLR